MERIQPFSHASKNDMDLEAKAFNLKQKQGKRQYVTVLVLLIFMSFSQQQRSPPVDVFSLKEKL